jgi:hypothetical protein
MKMYGLSGSSLDFDSTLNGIRRVPRIHRDHVRANDR